MSVLFFDSYSHYATVDIAKKYDAVDPTHVITTGGRYGSNALSASGSQGTAGTHKTMTGDIAFLNDSGIVGYNSYYPAIGTAGLGYFRHFQVLNGSTPLLTFVIRDSANGNGTMRVLRGDHDGTVLTTSAVAAVEAANHHHLEIRWLLDASNGEIEVRKDGVVIILAGGLNTGSGPWDTVAWFPNVNEKISHFYVIGQGGDRGNTFLGPTARVLLTMPDGNGTLNQWTPSAGANYQAVDDSTPNGDTDFVYARTPPRTDKYALASIAAVDVIQAVQVVATARRLSSAAPCLFATVIDAMFGANKTPTVAYRMYTDVYDLNATTEVAWTVADVNAAQAGVRRSV